MNKKIRELEKSLVAVLNSSDLIPEIKRLVVANVYNLIEKKANEAILSETALENENVNIQETNETK